MRFKSFAAALTIALAATACCAQPTSEGGTSSTGASNSGSGSSGGGATSRSSSGSASSGSSGGSSGAALCGGTACTTGLTCCGTKCADLTSDTSNCGSCGNLCPLGDICQGSTCGQSPCPRTSNCDAGLLCCGPACCDTSQVCCSVSAGASTWECFPADAGCPPGCVTPPCPISSKRYKKDIAYLTEAERDRLHDDLLKLPLATFRYKTETETAPTRLGFMVEDATSPACIAPPGDRVDLYGYATMAVAAVQAQEAEICELRAEIAQLKSRLDGPRQKAAAPSGP